MQFRLPWPAWLILLGAGACAPAGTAPREEPPPLDPQVASQLRKDFFEFAEALRMAGSADPRERARGLDKAAVMAPYDYFHWLTPTDQQLVARARGGDAAAAKELGRRGEAMEAYRAFVGPPNRLLRKQALRAIVAKGRDMADWLASVLLNSLLLAENSAAAGDLRSELVEIGEPARLLTIALLLELADQAQDVPGGRWEELTQLMATLINFGDQGVEGLRAVAESPKRYVRACAARAIERTRAIEHADLLAKLLLEDRAWEVRMEAALALGELRAREGSWRPLLAAMDKERDIAVKTKVIAALEHSDCVDAVPRLVQEIEDPKGYWEPAQEALQGLTGQRIRGAAAWRKWYEEKYPAWRSKRQP